MKHDKLTEQEQADLLIAEAKRMPGFAEAKGQTLILAVGIAAMRKALHQLKDSGQDAFDRINTRLDALEARLDALEMK